MSTKLLLSVLTLLCVCAGGVISARILFVTNLPSVSHQKVFQAVWKELSLRGHKVHAITPNPLNDPTLTNLTEIDFSPIYDLIKNEMNEEAGKYMLMKPNFLTVFLKDIFVTYVFNKLGETILKNENVTKFLSEEHTFDVTIVEWLFPTMIGFAAKYNTPLIGITSLGAPIVGLDAIGNPSHPIIAPDHNLPVTRDMPFRERLMAALYAVYVRIYYHLIVLPREDASMRKYLGTDLPYLGDIERNISVLLLNRNPIFHRIMPVLPTIIEFGGMKQNKTKQTLEKKLQRFLDESSQGFIYFSLGSNVKSTYLPDEIKRTIFEVFSELPYNVLWKWENENYPGKSKNIMYRKWVSQSEVLAHPNIKVFITQGGLQSLEEAIDCHVPIIGIPFHADQTSNVDTCVKYGMGLGIDLEQITKDNFKEAILTICSNSSFAKNSANLEQLLHDRPLDGLDRAIWWIEYVIRHPDIKYLRSPSLDISWIQYLMLDVIAAVLLVLLLVLLLVYAVFKGVCRLGCTVICLIWKRSVKKTNKVEEKKTQ